MKFHKRCDTQEPYELHIYVLPSSYDQLHICLVTAEITKNVLVQCTKLTLASCRASLVKTEAFPTTSNKQTAEANLVETQNQTIPPFSRFQIDHQCQGLGLVRINAKFSLQTEN